MDNNYLIHHGVLGMKWGVHRFKNREGGITEKGKKQFTKVSNSEWRQKRDTRRAKIVLARSHVKSDSAAKRYMNKAKKSLEKAKYDPENSKYMENYKLYKQKAMIEAAISKTSKERLSDISSNKIKAGRDFIVQRDFDVYPFVIPGVVAGGVTKVTDRIILK